jgi:hypothetical protein
MDRRGDVRAPVSVMGAVRSETVDAPVVLLDLSASGARIQADAPPDLASEYLLNFTVHNAKYQARLRVVHWEANDAAYYWGCSFTDLAPEQLDALRRTVNAAAGLTTTTVRHWKEIAHEARTSPDAQVLVGFTPAGHELKLAGQECLDIGRDGVELFVRTVASLEAP